MVTTQVLEYVPDVAGALAEMRRVLRPGGRLLVLDTDWDSLVWHAPDEELMARVLTTWMSTSSTRTSHAASAGRCERQGS